ncbi:PBSX family phage terminase large subunit [Thermoflavimicrobium dichotomicum]|uniref:Phage terminase large subunit n=1 Tax=Thermoflavimicrobium dichotomicum TaxID=46223 RepID=A0A1I3UK14_9BACL|nr:PBSX family phage terminase large subunit [Thermoflavimicrobium dichotomicum]SFJ83053.1 phage terminase large subunit [Thermoflavimicrobium dichotomicum]
MIVDVVVNQVYLPFLKDETRYQIFFGGSSSGKSYFLAQRAVLDVLEGHRNYLIVRNVLRTVKKSVFNEVIKSIRNMGLSDLFVINQSDLVITYKPTLKQILFAGLDDPEKIKSITPIDGVITDIWVEEATETKYEAIKQLDKRLRGQSKVKKRLTLSFNPILKTHWIYREYFGGWDDTKRFYRDENLIILKTTYKDNDFLEPDDIAALENETDRYYYEVYTLGNWGILGNVIFTNWEVQDLSEIRQTFDRFNNGLDFGFAEDPSALAHMHYDRKRSTLYILDELYERELTNDQLAKKLKRMIGDQIVVCDSSEPKSIKELRNFGVRAIPAKKGKDSVNFGIDWLKRQKIVIDIRCHNAKEEFQKYKWKEDKDGNVLPVPVDRDNHLIDAIRYGCEELMDMKPKLKAAIRF